MKMELRFNNTDIQTIEDGSMTVCGYVNKTETKSNMLGRNQKFKEVIKRGAWQRAIDNAKEIHFLAEHDNSKILASTRNDSLELREDDQGLYMTATISPTSYGKDYYQLIKDGILQNMSFGFRAVKDAWRNMGTHFERTVNELELFEVSVVRDPAYSNSTISARGIDVVEDIEIPNIQEVKEVKDMNKKALIEKKNDLLRKLEDIAETIEVEARGLTNDEETKTTKLKSDIEKLTKKIGGKEEINMIEVLGASDTIVEKRGFEAFIKGHYNSEEYRAITTSASPGQLIVPTTISDMIVQKIQEEAPLFAMANVIQTTGNIEILRETALGDAYWTAEMEALTTSDFAMEKIQLQQKRLASGIQFSQQLVNDSAFDVVSYAVSLLGRRLGLALEKAILVGTGGTTQMKGVLNEVLPSTSVVETTAVGAIGTDDILGAYTSMKVVFVKGSVFVMNRKTFAQISKLKNANNDYYLVDFKEAVGYTMLGLPILISDSMPDIAHGAKPIVLMNPQLAYTVAIKKGIEMKHIANDSTQALQGGQLLVSDIYVDGVVHNADALRILTVKSA
ncbi:phage major capsid protein [Peribacillus butanolivorans]|uniref:phage major capsid protein n=1 Tax=Peribacillus butanolivorans TaxID=421767 RepID=UPI0035D872CA